MWQMAGDVGKTDNHLLWLAIVGLTDQLIQERTFTLLDEYNTHP